MVPAQSEGVVLLGVVQDSQSSSSRRPTFTASRDDFSSAQFFDPREPRALQGGISSVADLADPGLRK